MDELALFAGAGGGVLAGHLLGWRTVCAVELNAYCRRILLNRQRDGLLDPFPIWDDIHTFDGRPWRGHIEVITGGFPCQDVSAAGKGAGLAGERSGLWFEMLRIIDEVRPPFVFAENSPNLRTRGLGTVIEGLTGLGYGVRWCVLGARHVGAPHRRDRMWILAHADSVRGGGEEFSRKNLELDICEPSQLCHGEGKAEPEVEDVVDTALRRDNRDTREVFSQNARVYEPKKYNENSLWQLNNAGKHPGAMARGFERERGDRWQTEPDVGRVAHGVAARVDRLKALGNGQVPSVAALAWEILTK
jgi:DNA (cytosine-5)-methyltransferase 1